MTKRNIQKQQYINENKQFRNEEDIVLRLRQTRANMIGTDDCDHYFDCMEAADKISELRLQITRPLTGQEVEALVLCKQYAMQQNNEWMVGQLNSILTRYIK